MNKSVKRQLTTINSKKKKLIIEDLQDSEEALEELANIRIEIQRMLQRGATQKEISDELSIKYGNIEIIEEYATMNNIDKDKESYVAEKIYQREIIYEKLDKMRQQKKTISKISTKPKKKTPTYRELNTLISQKVYPGGVLVNDIKKLGIDKLKVEDFKFMFNGSIFSFEASKKLIQDTIDSVKKGRNFGKGYLSSLGSALNRNLLKEGVYLNDYECVPSFIETRYIEYIYLANKYPQNNTYNNLEVIFPLYDAPLYSWINLEDNRLNLKAFAFAGFENINLSKYKKKKMSVLEEPIKKKLKKIGDNLKDTFIELYDCNGGYIAEGCNETLMFIGTTRQYIDFKKSQNKFKDTGNKSKKG